MSKRRDGRLFVRFTANGRQYERGADGEPFATRREAERRLDTTRALLDARVPIREVLDIVFGASIHFAAVRALLARSSAVTLTPADVRRLRLSYATLGDVLAKMLGRVE